MQYLGGKSKWGKKIVDAIEPWRIPGALWIEPFCGALNVTRHAKSPRIALDLCQPLITTLQAVQSGWIPPAVVSEYEYQRIKSNPNPWDPMTGFVLFGCSFGGKWSAGFARNKNETNYALQARNGLVRKIVDCLDVDLVCRDYRTIPIPPPYSIIYCDPPYEGTTSYAGVPPFNHAEFWAYAEYWAVDCGARVFVSEGIGARVPHGWHCFLRFTVPGTLGPSRRREELVFVHQSSPMARGAYHA